MIEDLRPYPEMKPSGVEWLPALPAGWEIHRAKYSFKEADDRSEAGGEELLSVSHKTGVTPRSQKNITMFMAESYEGHKVCRPGDVVVNTMWAWMAAIGVSRHVGIVSPAYGIYRPRAADRFEPKFLDYLLRTEIYRAEYLRSSRGITTSRLRLYPPDFLDIPFVQPPLDEQRLIVRFLDWHGAQAAKLIRAKKKIIALLNEQKQAIIHRAVTRGLDPNARFKNSGIPWLGDVPEGWEVVPCRALFAEIREREAPEEELLSVTIRSGVVRQRQLLENSSKKDNSNLDKTRYKLVLPGDIAYNKMRAWQGAFGASAYRGIISPAYVVQRPRVGALSPYYHYLLRTPSFAKEAEKWSYGIVSDMWSLRPEHFRLIYCPKPPEAEQKAICEHLEIATRDIAFAIQTFEREIALIQEFRTRLIADVVTGKLDVRAAATSLPETAELEATDDLAEGDDLDEVLDDSENEEVAA